MDREYLKREISPILAFRIGVDPIPDWAMTDRRIEWNSEKASKSNDPFEHFDDVYGVIKWDECEGCVTTVPNGYYIISEGGRLSACNEEMFNELYEEDRSKCIDVCDFHLRLKLKDIELVDSKVAYNNLISKIKRNGGVTAIACTAALSVSIITKDDLEWLNITLLNTNTSFVLRMEGDEIIESAKFSKNVSRDKQLLIINRILNILLIAVIQRNKDKQIKMKEFYEGSNEDGVNTSEK